VPVDPFIQPCWYAIQTHSWYEKRVRHQLTAHAITTFLPLWQQRRRWTDRVKVMEVPLLHGTSCQSHGERPWTLRGLHAPKFGRHLDTAGLSEPHI
jgi:Transcription termination factor nusG